MYFSACVHRLRLPVFFRLKKTAEKKKTRKIQEKHNRKTKLKLEKDELKKKVCENIVGHTISSDRNTETSVFLYVS